eukprot:NODE_4027_length_502_cov_6.836645_g3437_i0.p4 GENE.NODE_4027_length_502_cov_6.836645_g3437_i0~~NODE_4027_length_502_cov_6.836645_g3437_i0.p4  ORF type:complete len:63 (+),score=7.48 NODE_4027_length_502_cov_6.836645_g3437_i0:83-271(+)
MALPRVPCSPGYACTPPLHPGLVLLAPPAVVGFGVVASSMVGCNQPSGGGAGLPSCGVGVEA